MGKADSGNPLIEEGASSQSVVFGSLSKKESEEVLVVLRENYLNILFTYIS